MKYQVTEVLTMPNSEQVLIKTIFEAENVLLAKQLAETFYLEKFKTNKPEILEGLSFIAKGSKKSSPEMEYTLTTNESDNTGFSKEASLLKISFDDTLTGAELWNQRYSQMVVDNLSEGKLDYLRSLKK